MTDDETTTIQITVETWNDLKDRKQSPRDSFDDIIRDMLRETED